MFSNIVKSLDFVDCDGPLQSLTKSAKNALRNDDFCGVVYASVLKFKINVGRPSLQSGTADIASSPVCDLADSSGSYWVSWQYFKVEVHGILCNTLWSLIL